MLIQPFDFLLGFPELSDGQLCYQPENSIAIDAIRTELRSAGQWVAEIDCPVEPIGGSMPFRVELDFTPDAG
jgi:hypothetical protein